PPRPHPPPSLTTDQPHHDAPAAHVGLPGPPLQSPTRCVTSPGASIGGFRLSERQALLYQEWIANRRRLLAVVAEMEEVSRQAGELLLSEPHPELAGSTAHALPLDIG